jgi:hypothetical protein
MHQSAHSTAFYSFLPRFDTCTVASHRHALRLSSLHCHVLISIRTLYSLHLQIALVGWRCRLAHSRGSGKPYTLYISRSRELAVTSNHLSILFTFICSTVSFFSIYSNTDSSRALMCSFLLMRSNIPESSSGFGLGLLLLGAFRSLGPFGTLLVFFSVLFRSWKEVRVPKTGLDWPGIGLPSEARGQWLVGRVMIIFQSVRQSSISNLSGGRLTFGRPLLKLSVHYPVM